MIEKWRLYYEGGRTFDSTEGEPWESPECGVVAVGQLENGKFNDLLVNGPYFLYRSDWGCWLECEFDGLLDHLSHFAHLIPCVRQGRYIRKDEFKVTVQRARREIDESAALD